MDKVTVAGSLNFLLAQLEIKNPCRKGMVSSEKRTEATNGEMGIGSLMTVPRGVAGSCDKGKQSWHCWLAAGA